VTSEATRDPVTDHLLTPQNAALVVIDYQPSQVGAVRSIDHELLVDNIISVAGLAETFELPVVLSTINVGNGQGPTIPELRAVLSDSPEIDRTAINSWEDAEFRRAVEATGRKKLIMGGVTTDICLIFPSISAVQAGFDVQAVMDASGSSYEMQEEMSRRRMERAGVVLTTTNTIIAELVQDWSSPQGSELVMLLIATAPMMQAAD